jgi:hypothetical protein
MPLLFLRDTSAIVRRARPRWGSPPVVTVLARAYARKANRDRFKRRRDEWAEAIGEWRYRTASLPWPTPAGRRIAVCPATYSSATCKTCGACAKLRGGVIGFPAHGAWRQVEAAMAARDVPAGESWTFENHRTDFETQRQEWSGGKPADWAMEAFAFARNHSYGLLPRPSEQGTYSLPSAYVDPAVQDVALQLTRTISPAPIWRVSRH